MKVRNIREARFRGKQGRIYAKTVEESFCILQRYMRNGSLCGLWIEFGGPASRIPSKSNSPKIIYIHTRHGSRRPAITTSDSVRGRLAAMSHLFTERIVQEGIPVPSFGEIPVQVVVLLAKQSGKWDTHNSSKAIGDWLQSTGIINDDSQAEIYPLAKEDIYEPDTILGTTTLIIQPKQQVRGLTRAFIDEIKKASTGFEFIG